MHHHMVNDHLNWDLQNYKRKVFYFTNHEMLDSVPVYLHKSPSESSTSGNCWETMLHKYVRIYAWLDFPEQNIAGPGLKNVWLTNSLVN